MNICDTMKNNVLNLLGEKYPHILDAINAEGYKLEYLDYEDFKEIRFEDETVGFITFQRFTDIPNEFSINECYIIPEARGNDLLYNVLADLLLDENFNYFPRRPNTAFMHVLEKNNLTFKIPSNLIVSYMKFHVDIDDLYTNPDIERFYKKPDREIPYKANVFDKKTHAIFLRDPMVNFIKDDDFFACITPRQGDFEKYNCEGELQKINDAGLLSRYYTWQNNAYDIMDFFEETSSDLKDSISPEKVIGSEKKLSDDFVSMLEASGLDADDGFKIRSHIADAMNKNQLSIHSYRKRMQYLLGHFEDVTKHVDEVDEKTSLCPFCNEETPYYLKSCLKCGLSIREVDYRDLILANISVKSVLKHVVKSFFKR